MENYVQTKDNMLTVPNSDLVNDKTEISKIKLRCLIGVAGLSLFLIIVCLLDLLLILTCKDKRKKYDISTINTPQGIKVDTAYFTNDNKILLGYNISTSKNYSIGIMDEKGGNFKQIWRGNFSFSSELTDGNKIKILPFNDNKRLLIGDYIFKCEYGTFEDCKNGKLIEIHFDKPLTDGSKFNRTWSEILISPDDSHLVWTSIHTTLGPINFIANLLFSNDNNYYSLQNIKVISNFFYDCYDKDKNTFNVNKLKYGEVRQFLEGGSTISISGYSDSGFRKTISQSLIKDESHILTNSPSYENEMYVSPDGKYGVALSTVDSITTNFDIISLLYIPYNFLMPSLINKVIDSYSFDEVKTNRKGNIGPILLDLSDADHENYIGKNLNQDLDWVPDGQISWNKNSDQIIYTEKSKKIGDTYGTKRLRIVNLINYKMNKSSLIQNVSTPNPSSIPYATDVDYTDKISDNYPNMTIKGNFSGNFVFFHNISHYIGKYNNFSDDGKNTYDGTLMFQVNRERIDGKLYKEHIYYSDIEAFGEKSGKAKFNLWFNKDNTLNYNTVNDTPLTYGYSRADYLFRTVLAEQYKISN